MLQTLRMFATSRSRATAPHSSRHDRRLLAFVAVWAAAACCILLDARGASAARGQASVELNFHVQPLREPAVVGQVEAMDADSITIAGKKVAWTSVWFFHGPAPTIVSTGLVELRLTNGERLVGDILGGDEDGNALTLRSASFGSVEVAIDDIALVRVRGPSGWADEARFARARGVDERDIIFRETALGFDPVRGVLERVEAKGLRFEVEGGTSELFAWDSIAGLTLPRSESSAESKVSGDRLRLVVLTTEGSRVHVRGKTSDGEALVFEHARFGELRVDRARVLSGHVVDPSTRVLLSGLDPVEVVERDLLSETALYDWRRDRSVVGRELCVARRCFTSGIGAHAHSRLTFLVPDGVKELRSWIGADDSAVLDGRAGDMRYRILRGDEVLAEVASVRGGKAAQPLPPIAVEAGQRVVLEIDFGQALHILDRGDWLVPVFVR